MSYENEQEHTVEKKFDFLERKEKITNSVKAKVGLKVKKETDNSTLIFWNGKNGRRIISGVVAIAGMIGIHYNIDCAGWLIFLAFFML